MDHPVGFGVNAVGSKATDITNASRSAMLWGNLSEEIEADAEAMAAIYTPAVPGFDPAAAGIKIAKKQESKEETAEDDESDDLVSLPGSETSKPPDDIGTRALANVKPFLQALFDDGPLGSGMGAVVENDESTAQSKLISRQFAPSDAFRDALAREMAKPQVLNHCVSTDRCPLTTKSGVPTFTTFTRGTDSNAVQNIDGTTTSFSIFGVNSGTSTRYRGATDVLGFPMATRFDTDTDQTLDKIKHHRETLNRDVPTYHGTHYDERARVRETHVQSLLHTIAIHKAKPMERKPWIPRNTLGPSESALDSSKRFAPGWDMSPTKGRSVSMSQPPSGY